MQSLLVLGRQPEISLAELSSLYGLENIAAFTKDVALMDIDPCVLNFDRLGGSRKFAKVLVKLDQQSFESISDYLINVAPLKAKELPSGKLILGLSAYGFSSGVNRKKLLSLGLKIKKTLKLENRSVRFVPPEDTEISTAQVIHNKLTGQKAWDLIIAKINDDIVIAQTIKVQDIEAYGKRDQKRPGRDTKAGMLPPKLAQIIINLAAGRIPAENLPNVCDDVDYKPKKLNARVLDPFCGSGVILQEALMMGYDVTGSDINHRMIELSKQNMEWLRPKLKINDLTTSLSVGDATTYQWESPFNFVASEIDLGEALISSPDKEKIASLATKANALLEKFLTNIKDQTKPGFRLCLAIPSWEYKGKMISLPLIDHLDSIGYNQLDFQGFSSSGPLIYHRAGQRVGRQLLILSRK